MVCILSRAYFAMAMIYASISGLMSLPLITGLLSLKSVISKQYKFHNPTMRKNITNHHNNILKHIQKITTMVNAPSLQRPVLRQDSDDEYYDDYILDDHSSSSEEPQYEIEWKKPQKIVTLADISTLPILTASKEEEICSVCLDQLATAERNTILPCTHKYHYECIRDWLLIKNKCPTCNHVVF